MTRAQAAHNHFRIQGQRARKTMAKSWVMVKLERDGQIGNSQTANKGKRLLLTEQQCSLRRARKTGREEVTVLISTGHKTCSRRSTCCLMS